VRRATKICRHSYSLVKIGTASTADSLVEMLRNKYRKDESKDKKVTSAKLQGKKDKIRKQTRRQIRKQRNYYYYYYYYYYARKPAFTTYSPSFG
jgi:hypothetical protein